MDQAKSDLNYKFQYDWSDWYYTAWWGQWLKRGKDNSYWGLHQFHFNQLQPLPSSSAKKSEQREPDSIDFYTCANAKKHIYIRTHVSVCIYKNKYTFKMLKRKVLS